jgi:hypothetical protein
VFVVLDTFAMCFDGDENSSRDIAMAVAAAKRIIRETGATVVLVHHTGKRGDGERGHSALRAAADTMILVKNDGHGGITVSNNKQKDVDTFEPITLRLRQVSVGLNEEGEPVTSCILESAGSPKSFPQGLTDSQTQALATLAGFPGSGSSSAWQKAIADAYGFVVPKKTFHNWRNALLEKGVIEPDPGQKHHYRVTDLGRVLVAEAAECQLALIRSVAPQDLASVPDADSARKEAGHPRPIREPSVS